MVSLYKRKQTYDGDSFFNVDLGFLCQLLVILPTIDCRYFLRNSVNPALLLATGLIEEDIIAIDNDQSKFELDPRGWELTHTYGTGTFHQSIEYKSSNKHRNMLVRKCVPSWCWLR